MRTSLRATATMAAAKNSGRSGRSRGSAPLSPDVTTDAAAVRRRRKTPRSSQLDASNRHARSKLVAAKALGKQERGGCSRRTREGQLPSKQKNGLRRATLPRHHGRPRARSNKPTTPPRRSTSPPRPAGRSAEMQDTVHQEEGRRRRPRLIEAASVGITRACFTMKLSHGGSNPKPGSGRRDPRSSTAAARSLYSTKQGTNLQLRLPAPPHRRSPSASPARATAVWAGSLFRLLVTVAGGEGRGEGESDLYLFLVWSDIFNTEYSYWSTKFASIQ
jgi:hypothetical protein